MKKALMISTYPPENCGIGAYARQQAAYMRENGWRVDVLALKGNGKYTAELNTPEKILALRELCRGYDKTVIQYHESFFYHSADTQYRIRMHKAFEELFRSVPGIEVVCHEIKFPEGKGSEDDRKAKVKKWLAAPKVLFHTRVERANYCRALGIREEESRTELVSAHKYYTRNRDIPKAQARAELGIPAEQQVFLCIGFIQPHKAFDKVAEAFEQIPSPGNRHLYIVGSLRLVNDETRLYLRTLEQYSERNANIHLVSSYISDEQFDTWLIAADCVVLPYREIWSSGVMGRSKIFGKPCIVRNVGGLSEQTETGDILFKEYDELSGILEKYVAASEN